jgi:hypothetical protein
MRTIRVVAGCRVCTPHIPISRSRSYERCSAWRSVRQSVSRSSIAPTEHAPLPISRSGRVPAPTSRRPPIGHHTEPQAEQGAKCGRRLLSYAGCRGRWFGQRRHWFGYVTVTHSRIPVADRRIVGRDLRATRIASLRSQRTQRTPEGPCAAASSAPRRSSGMCVHVVLEDPSNAQNAQSA